MRLIDADALCKDLLERWSVAETRKEELIKAVMADVVTPIIVLQPTIEPEPHWIPCNERLPDYEGYDEVLTTVNGRAENVRYINAVITNAEYDDTDKQWYINGCAAKWVARNGKVMSDVDVLAWMPLPEPWKGEEE